MRVKVIILSVCFIACCASGAHAQQSNVVQQSTGAAQAQQQAAAAEQRVPLTEQPVAFDATGRAALAGRLLTTALNGTSDAPLKNVRLVVENRSADFYTYITGWATFYDQGGVRCGEGMFKLDALAPQESAETDTPGLRLTCSPSAWRIVAVNLLTRAGDTARPIVPLQNQATTGQEQTSSSLGPQPGPAASTETTAAPPLFVNVSVDGRAYRVPLGGTLEIPVNKKRTRITVTASQQ